MARREAGSRKPSAITRASSALLRQYSGPPIRLGKSTFAFSPRMFPVEYSTNRQNYVGKPTLSEFTCSQLVHDDWPHLGLPSRIQNVRRAQLGAVHRVNRRGSDDDRLHPL